MDRRFPLLIALVAFVLGVTRPAAGQTAAARADAPARPRSRPIVPLDSFKLPQPNKLGDARQPVVDMRQGRRIVLDPTTKKVSRENLEALNAIAKSNVYILTEPVYYRPTEPDRNGQLRPTAPELTLQSRFDEAERFILVPTWGSRFNIDQADYIVAFGEAMDAAVRDILQPKPAKPGEPPPAVPEIMQINAARMLAVAAKSGAPAHYPTILALLQNPDTDPAVLLWAIKAAEGLIAAFNPVWAGDARYAVHTVKDAEMVKLVSALDALVKRTKPYGAQIEMPKPPPAPPNPLPAAKPDPKAPPPLPSPAQIQAEMFNREQQEVVRYFRRAALKALAQVRFSQFVDPQTGASVRPLNTLAKMATGDPTITNLPGYDEIAIAVAGLCNLHDYKDVNFDALCDCIAQGVYNFAGKKAGSAQDKTIPWKTTGSQLITALTDWQKVPSAGRFRGKMESLSSVLIDGVLVPLEKVGVAAGKAPALDALARWREQNKVTELKLYLDGQDPAIRPGFTPAL